MNAIHPTHGRARTPARHKATVRKIHDIHAAAALGPLQEPVWDANPTESLLLAIWGLEPGESAVEALARLRRGAHQAAVQPTYLPAIKREGPCDGSHGLFCPECASVNRGRDARARVQADALR